MRHGPNVDFGNVSERVELRNNLQCKSFKWFIDNIYPEMEIPNNVGAGFIKNNASNHCLDYPYVAANMKSPLGIYVCHNLGGNQYLEFSQTGNIMRNQRCLERSPSEELVFVPCNNFQPLQKWTYNQTTYQIYHESSAKCLSYNLNAFLRPSVPLLEPCDLNSDKQKWNFQFMMTD
jgi:polypeptide N-acetylgalactosaminyltransferase